MPVEPRGNGYLATVSHKGERFRRQFPSRIEAEAWELKSKAALLNGELPVMKENEGDDGAPATLKALLEKVETHVWAGKAGAKTAIINANKCIKDLGNIQPSKVTTVMIDELAVKWAGEGTADSTINRRLSALSKMLRFAEDRGWVAKRPKMLRKKERDHRIRFLSAEEEANLIAYFKHISQPDMADFVAVAVDTGLRRGELMRVEARDMLPGDILMVWQGKTASSRRGVPMTSRVKEILARRAKSYPTGPLWPGWTIGMISHYWDSARRHLGMLNDPQFVLHALRHTFCSRLVQRGVDILTVSKLAGHTTLSMTMRYAHLAPHNLVHAIKMLEPAQEPVVEEA